MARCHAEEPAGIWFDLSFLKHRCGLTNSFGGLITSSCSVSHWSPFPRTLGDGETEAQGGDSGDVTPVRGCTPGRARSNSAFCWTENVCARPRAWAPKPHKNTSLGPNSGHVTRSCPLGIVLHLATSLYIVKPGYLRQQGATLAFEDPW